MALPIDGWFMLPPAPRAAGALLGPSAGVTPP